MSVNKVILVGHLGADPETRTTGSGMMVANMRLATNERRKDESGTWADATEWHRVVCFGKVAENVSRYLKKGRQIYVEGKIRTRKWTDKDGNEKWTTEILADNVTFLGGGRDGGGSAGGGGGGYPSGGGGYSGGGSSDESGGGGSADDDIPF